MPPEVSIKARRKLTVCDRANDELISCLLRLRDITTLRCIRDKMKLASPRNANYECIHAVYDKSDRNETKFHR